MKVLIIGSGGREDALAWKFNEESNVSKVIVCPGNPGMTRLNKVELLNNMNHNQIADWSADNGVDLCVCGPEAPLTRGISEEFKRVGVSFFGPSKEAAMLEGSKIYSKEFMAESSIPTAQFKVAANSTQAYELIDQWDFSKGLVLKADGLAGGKGVVVTYSLEVAKQTIFDFMEDPSVSIKTERILLEEVLPGEEVSCFALCSGEDFFFLGSACDHKRVGDGDQGPNTGGMGCYRDRRWPDSSLEEDIINRVVKPTLKGMKDRGAPFTGFLFMGLMVDATGAPSVIEYNVRMGDPETQTLLPLVGGSLSEALKNLADGKPAEDLHLAEMDSVHVVMTSGGYPSIGKHELSLNHPIAIDQDFKNSSENQLFFAGVKECIESGSGFMNSGGRVLGVTSTGDSIKEARQRAYLAMGKISFKDSHYRKDIGLVERGNLN